MHIKALILGWMIGGGLSTGQFWVALIAVWYIVWTDYKFY